MTNPIPKKNVQVDFVNCSCNLFTCLNSPKVDYKQHLRRRHQADAAKTNDKMRAKADINFVL